MPRRLVKKLTPRIDQLRDKWYIKPFGDRVTDTRLWSVNRRSVCGAFGAGLAICFLPLPVHLPLAIFVAIVGRLNVPVLLATIFLVNPFTVVPVYYAAYRLGTLLLGDTAGQFRFELSWDWLQYGLGPLWKPFLLGCLVASVAAGVFGRFGLDLLWRRLVRQRYRARRRASTAQ